MCNYMMSDVTHGDEVTQTNDKWAEKADRAKLSLSQLWVGFYSIRETIRIHFCD